MLQRYKLDEQQALICSKAAQKTQHLHQHSMLRSSAQRSSQRECSVASQVSVSHSGSVSRLYQCQRPAVVLRCAL